MSVYRKEIEISVDATHVLDQIDIRDIVEYYEADELVSEIGIDAIVEKNRNLILDEFSEKELRDYFEENFGGEEE